MTTITFADMTSAELAFFFNENCGDQKQVKRFSDRATAIKRCEALLASMSQQEFAVDESSKPYGFEVHGQVNCPCCGIDLMNGVSQHGDDVNGKPLRHDTHEFECMGCGGGFGKTLRHAAKSTSRANAIAATWKDASIAAARAQRTCVRVFCKNSIIGEYKSTAEAFRRLGLPLAKHIPFRMALKAAGSNEISVYTFKVAA